MEIQKNVHARSLQDDGFEAWHWVELGSSRFPVWRVAFGAPLHIGRDSGFWPVLDEVFGWFASWSWNARAWCGWTAASASASERTELSWAVVEAEGPGRLSLLRLGNESGRPSVSARGVIEDRQTLLGFEPHDGAMLRQGAR